MKDRMLLNSKELVENYLYEKTWRVKENSNSPKSFGGLNKYLAGEVSKSYWLNDVYTYEMKKAYLEGRLHYHDMGGLTIYCCGFSLENILLMGVQGVPNIPKSAPAKHFSSVLNQVANLTTVYQNEIMGAVAFNSVDTLLAPFIAYDGLDKKKVKQELQNFIYSINSNSRGGAEPAFSNITLDITPSEDMLKKPVIIGGVYDGTVYGDYQKEMDMFNEVFTELMLEGDADGEPFAYPILTYNIGKRFDWENPKSDPIFEMAGRYGYPYFANFGKNSEMESSDIRSMCCRFRLDLRELRKRNGGLFGSGDNTGSIGVATINLPRIGYVAKNEVELFAELDKVLVIAKDSLELKRVFLQERILDGGLLHAYSRYVGTLDNHFSTIGVLGMNEMCLNFLGNDILSGNGRELALKVGDYIRNRMSDFQEETGNLYNYEATPAESTAYRLAKKDLELFPDIITSGTPQAPYYTNSCHIPVGKVHSIKETYDHQDDLQAQFTGGTVIHNYMDGGISGKQAKHIIRTIMEEYKAPYTSLSPITRYCPEHGYVKEKVDNCPKCMVELKKYQRITGYTRPVEMFNVGKAQEFKERTQLEGDKQW
jgi:anaerobic ribonucleoside-triphosphate reductase